MASHTHVPPVAIQGRPRRTPYHHLAGEARVDPAMCPHAAPADYASHRWMGSSGDAGILPNEAEINSMGVAELRQTMLGLVRQHKAACSQQQQQQQQPTSAAAAVAHDAIHPGSPPSPNSSMSSYASVSSLATPGGAFGTEVARARQQQKQQHGPAAPALQSTRLDMLLNATTISDHMDCSEQHPPPPELLPSPLVQYRHSPSPPPPADARWGPATRRLPALPPISHMAQSAPADSLCRSEAGGPSSLEAYRISSAPMKYAPPAGHAHSFPPPLSATRSQPGYAHRQSPPPGAVAIPVPSTAAHPPPGDYGAYPDMHYSQPGSYARSPTMRAASHHSHSRQYHPYPQPSPAHHPAPPVSPHSAYAQVQGCYTQHLPPHPHHQQQQPPPQPYPQHPAMLAAQPVPVLHRQQMAAHAPAVPPAVHMAQQQQQQHMAGVHLTSSASVQIPLARNVSKPKFNYAFLDTKRPRGPSSRWTGSEDELLKRAVAQFGEDRQWVKVAQQVPGRTNLQCRQRWLCNIKAQVAKEKAAAGKK